MTRRTWTPRRKLAVFEAHSGRCHLCHGKIDGTREPWELEHIIPLAMGGADDETNVAPAHVACHRAKTTKDAGQIAKANRVRAKHKGSRVQLCHGLGLAPGKRNHIFANALPTPARRFRCA